MHGGGKLCKLCTIAHGEQGLVASGSQRSVCTTKKKKQQILESVSAEHGEELCLVGVGRVYLILGSHLGLELLLSVTVHVFIHL